MARLNSHDRCSPVVIKDTEGESHFCESKGGQVTFSLGFDFLASCMYIKSWPKIVIEVKAFDKFG